MRTRISTLMLAALLGCSSLVQAASITVVNAGFELPGGASGNYPAPTSWTPIGAGGIFTELFSDIGNPTGGELLRYGGTDGNTLSQDLGVAFLPNSVYTVNFLIGNRVAYNEGFTQYGLQSSANVGVDLGTIVSVDGEALYAENTFNEGPTYTFTTGAVAPTGNVVVFFRGLDQVGGASPGNRAIVDFARVSVNPVAVPEPATWTLLGCGAFGVLFARRRKFL